MHTLNYVTFIYYNYMNYMTILVMLIKEFFYISLQKISITINKKKFYYKFLIYLNQSTQIISEVMEWLVPL